MSQQRHHSPTVLPIPKSQGDCGMSLGLPCPNRGITVPLSFPAQSPKGTVGCPRDSHVLPETSQSHCPSHPKVPLGLWDVLGTPVSQQRHHRPTVLPIPKAPWDCGMFLGLLFPSRHITIPIPKSQGDCGMSSGLPCPSRDITVPLSFLSQSPLGTAGCPRVSHVHQRHHSPIVLPIAKSQGDCGMSPGLPCPSGDITVPLSFPSQSPLGTMGCPWDSHAPAETSQSHCPSHPKVPLGLWDVLWTPMSYQRHHSSTVLPIPKSQGKSLGSCLTIKQAVVNHSLIAKI